MRLRKPCLMRNVLLAFLFVIVFASLGAAAERTLGATAAARANIEAQAQMQANMGVSGPGSDLRRISTRRAPQTLTGFPEGALPGDTIGGGSGSETPLLRTAMSGEPLAPAIGQEMLGAKFDRISTIAAHLGYTIVKIGYSPTVMDTPYSFALMNGNRKVSTLYFNRAMALAVVQ